MCICFRFLLPTFVDFLWKPSHLMPPQFPSCFENHRRGKWLWSLLYRTLFFFDSSYYLINGINDFLVIWHYGHVFNLHQCYTTRLPSSIICFNAMLVLVIEPNLFSDNLHDNNVIVRTWFNRECNIFARKWVYSKRSTIFLL